jgi:hypothetical protein
VKVEVIILEVEGVAREVIILEVEGVMKEEVVIDVTREVVTMRTYSE